MTAQKRKQTQKPRQEVIQEEGFHGQKIHRIIKSKKKSKIKEKGLGLLLTSFPKPCKPDGLNCTSFFPLNSEIVSYRPTKYLLRIYKLRIDHYLAGWNRLAH